MSCSTCCHVQQLWGQEIYGPFLCICPLPLAKILSDTNWYYQIQTDTIRYKLTLSDKDWHYKIQTDTSTWLSHIVGSSATEDSWQNIVIKAITISRLCWYGRQYSLVLVSYACFLMKWSRMLMGMGKMMVELCSAEMVLRVCRYLSYNTGRMSIQDQDYAFLKMRSRPVTRPLILQQQ